MLTGLMINAESTFPVAGFAARVVRLIWVKTTKYVLCVHRMLLRVYRGLRCVTLAVFARATTPSRVPITHINDDRV